MKSWIPALPLLNSLDQKGGNWKLHVYLFPSINHCLNIDLNGMVVTVIISEVVILLSVVHLLDPCAGFLS